MRIHLFTVLMPSCTKHSCTIHSCAIHPLISPPHLHTHSHTRAQAVLPGQHEHPTRRPLHGDQVWVVPRIQLSKFYQEHNPQKLKDPEFLDTVLEEYLPDHRKLVHGENSLNRVRFTALIAYYASHFLRSTPNLLQLPLFAAQSLGLEEEYGKTATMCLRVSRGCLEAQCNKLAVSSGKEGSKRGKVDRCRSHGGGPRCRAEGCNNGAVSSGKEGSKRGHSVRGLVGGSALVRRPRCGFAENVVAQHTVGSRRRWRRSHTRGGGR
jgi:hypothetical protein